MCNAASAWNCFPRIECAESAERQENHTEFPERIGFCVYIWLTGFFWGEGVDCNLGLFSHNASRSLVFAFACFDFLIYRKRDGLAQCLIPFLPGRHCDFYQCTQLPVHVLAMTACLHVIISRGMLLHTGCEMVMISGLHLVL